MRRDVGMVTTTAMCLLAAGLIANAVAKQSSAEEPRVVLRQTNHFEGPGELRVSFPRDVRLNLFARSLFGSKGISIEGGGRIVGLVLQADPVWRVEPVLAALRVNECSSRRCPSSAAKGAVMKTVFPFDRSLTIAAGNYRLFLIGDGPIELTWTIPSFSGTTTATASAPIDLDLATPTSTITNRKGATLYEASRTYALTSRMGMAFSTTWVRGDSRYKGARITYCFSDDEGIPALAATSTAAACLPVSKSSFGSFHDVVAEDDEGRFVLNTFIFLSPYDNGYLPGDGSRWTYGFVATAPGESVSAGSQAMILSY